VGKYKQVYKMLKFTNKIAICMLVGLAFLPLSAYSNNSLTQLDIKKSMSSDSTLNVTIYTSSPYDDNVAVSKKAENKYVILMPNVSGSAQSKPDLSGLHDVISDVDVKSMQDGENGYTKVTLTTTKPVTIKTATKRSAPLTAEQKAYKNLIAQSRTNKPVSNTNNTSKTTIKFNNSTATAPAVPAVPAKTASAASAPAPKQETKPLLSLRPLDFSSVSKDTSAKQNSVKEVAKPKAEPATTVKTDVNSDLEKYAPLGIPVADDKVLQPNSKTENINTETPANVKQNNNKDEVTKLASSSGKKINKRIAPNMLTTFALLMFSLLGLTLLFKFIKKSIEHSNFLKQSFKENLMSKPVEVESYDDIVNDSDLTWQEKYQKFVNNTKNLSAGKSIVTPIDGGDYRFANEIATDASSKSGDNVQYGFSETLDETFGDVQSAQLKPKKGNKFKAYNRTAKNISPENIPPIKKVKNQNLNSQKSSGLRAVDDDFERNYRELEESLERSLHNAPDVEEMNIVINEESLLKQIENKFNTAPVFNESDKIAETMHKTRKLKAFANKMALEETKRNVPNPKMRSEIRKSRNIESKHVELGSSSLHTNPRKLEGGNLSVADLIVKSDKFINPAKSNKSENKSAGNKGYSTVTIDEFFDEVDKSSSITASASLASKVADSLGKISTESNVVKIQEKVQQKVNPFDGVVIKSGYNINDNCGFYVVRNNSGTTSLIGRINNDTTLLKDFGNTENVKLQVRADSANVYMVKANGYRYLVEINNNKMGVLLEL